MGSQSELFARAAVCERLMKQATDRSRKRIFKHLRDMWIALANESVALSRPVISNEVEKIEMIQSRLVAEERNDTSNPMN